MNTPTLAALFTAIGLLLGSPVVAEENGHEGHHPAGTAEKSQPPKTDNGSGGDDKAQTQGGMMGGDKCKMMEDMQAKMGGMKPKGDAGPASYAFYAIMMRLQKEAGVTYSGNADLDFAKAMMPHHQAAIDMAKTVMAFGKDPEIRKLAEDAVKTHEEAMARLKDWLEKNGKK